MKRRSFFGSIFGAALAPVAPAESKEEAGVMWQPICRVCRKLAPVEIFVSLEKPVGPGIQCPFCLGVYDTTSLGNLIRDYNLQHGRNV